MKALCQGKKTFMKEAAVPRECRPPGLPGRLESSTLSLLPTEVSLQCHLHRPFGEQGAAIRLARAAGVSRWRIRQEGWSDRHTLRCLPSLALTSLLTADTGA